MLDYESSFDLEQLGKLGPPNAILGRAECFYPLQH